MSPQLHDDRHQVIRGGGVEAPPPFPFEPNFIDWRTSRGRADRRAQADDQTLEICAHCETEIDVVQPAHRPNCAGIGAPRASSATVTSLPAPPREKKHTHRSGTKCPVAGCKWQARHEPDGLELLERMDAGLSVADDEPDASAFATSNDVEETELPELEEVPEAERLGPDGTGTSSSTGAEPELADEEAAAVGDFTVSGTAGSGSSSEPERAAATSNGKPTRKRVWTQELVLAGLKRWAREHNGAAPTQGDWVRRGEYWPAFSTAAGLFGSWGAAIEAAGLAIPTRGRRPAHREQPLAEQIRGADHAADKRAEPTTRLAPSQAERPEPKPLAAPVRSADPPPASTRDRRADRGRTQLRRHPRSGAHT